MLVIEFKREAYFAPPNLPPFRFLMAEKASENTSPLEAAIAHLVEHLPEYERDPWDALPFAASQFFNELRPEDREFAINGVLGSGSALDSLSPGVARDFCKLGSWSDREAFCLLHGIDPNLPKKLISPSVEAILKKTERASHSNPENDLFDHRDDGDRFWYYVTPQKFLEWAHDNGETIDLTLTYAFQRMRAENAQRRATNPFRVSDADSSILQSDSPDEKLVTEILLSHDENRDSWHENEIGEYLKGLNESDRQKFIEFVRSEQTVVGSITPARAREHAFYDEMDLDKALRLLNGIDPDLPRVVHNSHIYNKVKKSEEALRGTKSGRKLLIVFGGGAFGSTDQIRLSDLLAWAFESGHPINPVFAETFTELQSEREERANRNPYKLGKKSQTSGPSSQPNAGANARKIEAL